MTPRSASRNKTNTIVGSVQAAPVKQTWQWGKQQKRSPAKGLFWELGFVSVAFLQTEWDARPPARWAGLSYHQHERTAGARERHRGPLLPRQPA